MSTMISEIPAREIIRSHSNPTVERAVHYGASAFKPAGHKPAPQEIAR
jgi:enolase